MKATPHPELLPALHSAEQLQRFISEHPETLQAHDQLYGNKLAKRLKAIGRDITLGNIDAPRILAEMETIRGRLSHLAAPGGNWN